MIEHFCYQRLADKNMCHPGSAESEVKVQCWEEDDGTPLHFLETEQMFDRFGRRSIRLLSTPTRGKRIIGMID
jgi:hypothetical protein